MTQPGFLTVRQARRSLVVCWAGAALAPCCIRAGIPRFMVLCRSCVFHHVKVCSMPVLNKSIGPFFPIVLGHFTSLSYFGNSRNIGDVFIVIFYGNL